MATNDLKELSELLELNDSKKEFNSELRQVRMLSTATPMDLERWNNVVKRLRNTLDIAEEIQEPSTVLEALERS
jgi:hypothetical protein